MIPLILTLTAAPTSITVDATKGQPISPYIYGVNHPDWDKLGIPATMSRQGGNRMTAYNWETNASNAGSDWQHQNDGYLGESNEPGWTVRRHVTPALQKGAAALVTVPTLGYVAADKKADGDVNKTPNYLQVRFHKSLPKKPGGKFSLKPNTADKVVYQDEFVKWVESLKPNGKGSVWYSLDNEPDLWSHTHARIFPKPITYAQLLANNTAFAQGVKSAAPKSMVFGPANYGWMGFKSLQGAPDAKGRDFIDFYLAGMKAAGAKSGRRLLDVLDIHWYPEARGDGTRITFSDKKSLAIDIARVHAPRSLWDPTYVEDSWIAESIGKKPIKLLPTVQAQIAKQYPGTKLAITEYDFGGENVPSGMIAQADVLGLFGRYGVFAASHWGISHQKLAQVAGFRAFLAFDGKSAKFGSRSLAVSGANPAVISVFAASDPGVKGRLTIVAINRSSSAQQLNVGFKGFTPKSVKGYRARHDQPRQPASAAASVSGGKVTSSLPAMSVTTIEVRG